MKLLAWAIQCVLAVPLLAVWRVLFACSIGAGGAMVYKAIVEPAARLPAASFRVNSISVNTRS